MDKKEIYKNIVEHGYDEKTDKQRDSEFARKLILILNDIPDVTYSGEAIHLKWQKDRNFILVDIFKNTMYLWTECYDGATVSNDFGEIKTHSGPLVDYPVCAHIALVINMILSDTDIESIEDTIKEINNKESHLVIPLWNPSEFATVMNILSDSGDTEGVHIGIDEAMCALLRSLGYDDGVDVWDDTDKWFA